jgi:predicted transposase/invertase (TIGR01784 family)
MPLAPLNNSVVFKKLFTDPEIVAAFVEDLIGVKLELQANNIVLEKKFSPPIGAIDIALDIFIDDPKHRLIIEIQKVRYDYHFDRFLHYHQAAIVELAKSHKAYKLDRTVHTIVWLTRKVREQAYQHSLITTSLSSVTERGEELHLYPHKLYFLNPYYLNDQTPAGLVDWFQLVVESIVNPNTPQINRHNKFIEKAAQVIAEDGLTPQEMVVLLEETGYEENLRLHREEGRLTGRQEGQEEGRLTGRQEGQIEIARTMHRKGFDIALIAEVTGLSIEELDFTGTRSG